MACEVTYLTHSQRFAFKKDEITGLTGNWLKQTFEENGLINQQYAE